MSQFARPFEDTNNVGNYVNQVGGSVNLFQSIDEVVLDANDFIKSPNAPNNAVYVTKLTSVTDPLASTGHIIRFAARKDPTNLATLTLTVELRQGYVDETTKGTLIATVVQILTGTLITYEFTLAPAEADLITNYANLFLRFVSDES